MFVSKIQTRYFQVLYVYVDQFMNDSVVYITNNQLILRVFSVKVILYVYETFNFSDKIVNISLENDWIERFINLF